MEEKIVETPFVEENMEEIVVSPQVDPGFVIAPLAEPEPVEVIEESFQVVEPPKPTTKEKPKRIVLSYSNPVAYTDGKINCTVVHTDLGEIPFTYDPAEDTQAMRELEELLFEDGVEYCDLDKCPTVEMHIIGDERAWRNAELREVDIIINKIEDFQLEGESQPWRMYRCKLRDWPASELFPNPNKRPVSPE